jgi:hypothetical protein
MGKASRFGGKIEFPVRQTRAMIASVPASAGTASN